MHHHSRAVVLSGCSGGGKSSILSELAARGYRTFDEPGRRIVRDEIRTSGSALPWIDAPSFARRCIDVARRDLAQHDDRSWAFFDRCLVDADTALRHSTGASACPIDELQKYHRRVFLTPPWPELYATDDERRLDFADAVGEYTRLLAAYDDLGYAISVLPRASVRERVDVILSELDLR